jgi:transposase-like protein
MASLCYRRHRFPPEVTQLAIWLYLRFTLTTAMSRNCWERGLDISYQTVRRWVLKFGPAIARWLRQRRPPRSIQTVPRHELRVDPALTSPREAFWQEPLASANSGKFP